MSSFHELQTFDLWVWCVVLVAGGLLPLGLSFIANLPRWTRVMLRTLVAVIPGLLLLFVGVMQTDVNDHTLTVHFGYTTFFNYTYDLSSLDSASVRHYNAVSEYGGWGVKIGNSGLSYSMRGDSGVQLVVRTKSGSERILIGTEHASALAAVLAHR